MSERAARWGLFVVLLAYLAAGTVYSLLAPLGEAPDEMEQFHYMRYIVEQRRLPRTAQDRLEAAGKSHEPPLYYSVLGLATSWIDTRPLPHIKMLDPDRWPRHSLPDEVLINLAPLHTADEAWPFRGLVLVWHLARLLSLALMAGALAVLYRVVREVCPGRPELALLATAAAAFSPQLVYIGASLNNDALAALLGGLVLWLLLRLARSEAGWGQFLLLGALLGLARLTKFYNLALLPVVAVVLAVVAWRRRQVRHLGGLAVALALAFAIPLPWLLYIQPSNPNVPGILRLFDIVHMERWFSPAGEGQAGTGILAIGRALLGVLRLQPLDWALTLCKSYWGYFGAMTVQAPGPVYLIAAVLCGLALFGWLRILAARLRRRPALPEGSRELWIPGLQVLAFLAVEAVFYGVMKRLPDTAQARHLYPALAGPALFLALGWWGLSPRLASRPGIAGLSVLLLGLAGFCLPTVVHSVRRPLLPVRSAPWPDAPQAAQAIPLGDGLAFDGARFRSPGPGLLEGTLYWQALQPPEAEAIITLELVDSSGAVRAVWAGHPGGSRCPTQAWDGGDYVRQELSWPLPAPFPAGPQAVRLRVLREGHEVTVLPLPPVELPATGAAPVGSAQQPAALVYGLDPAAAHLRDTVLLTWPGGGPEELSGPDGARWRPVARTTRGDQAALVVDPRVQPGRYAAEAGAGQGLAVTVDARRRTFEAPGGLQSLGTTLGDAVELVGYQLGESGVARVSPGGTLSLRLVWRARQRVGRHYTVFTHLIDGQGRLWGQHDKLPGQEYSTLFWAPGEVVVDDYALPVDRAAPPGTYRVAVGLYQALTGARATIQDAQGRPVGNQLLVGEVQVAGP